jgi:hypothetical protein
MGDAGEMLMGPFGRELCYWGQLLFIIFLMASHILTFTVLFNTITNHGTCTIVFGVIGLVVSCICALPRTTDKVFIMSTVSAVSILTATIVTMISIGVQAPDNVQNDITTDPTFVDAFLAVTNIVFAFIAHVSFFGIMSEMQDPAEFPKSLAMLQIVDTIMYIVTAMVIYCYAGPDVSSPALSSAGPLMKKVAYGLAIPTVRSPFIIDASRTFLLIKPIGYRRRCRFRSRCMQVYLRPDLPWRALAPYASAESVGHWYLGRNWSYHLDHCVGHCRVYPCL